MKRTLSLLLSALLLLSSAVICVSAAPADVVVTVDGVPYVTGQKICAVSTVELTLPVPVANLSAVTFSEQTKLGDNLWFGRNFDGALSADKKTVTATFERGDISSNSKYKFEFDTDGAAGAEYAFEFETKMEEGVYFAENFTRFKSHVTHDLDWGNGVGNFATDPSNRNPIVKARGWTGGAGTVGNTAITTFDGFPVLKIGGQSSFVNLGVNAKYSAPLPALHHVGESTTEFKMANYLKYADFGGITVFSTDEDATDGITMQVSIDTVNKAINADNNYTHGVATVLGTKTYPTLTEVNDWHTISFVTDTTFTSASAAYVKKLLKVTLDGTTIWETDGTNQISFPTTNSYHGSAGGQGFNKAVPALPAAASQIGYTQLWAAQGTALYIRYADYKDYAGVMNITSESQTNAGISDSITINFCDVPRTVGGSSAPADLAPEFATQISLTKVSDSSTVVLAIDEYDATSNSVTVTPNVPLEHNTAYKLTMASRNYKMLGTGDAKDYTFTTGWAKLLAETTEDTVASTNFAPAVSVENVTSAALTYDTILALYKTENGITNQVAAVTTTQASLATGETADINVGTVSDPNPTASATYFAKVFFVAGGDAVAEPIVIGSAPVAPVTPVDSISSVMTDNTEPNTGRLDVNGKVVGSLPNRALFVTVMTGTTPVYYDVLTSGTTGDFAFGFNLNPASGGASVPTNYTVTVKPSDQIALPTLPVTFDFSGVTPEITSLTISGTPAYQETLTAAYSIYDFVGRSDVSTIQWYSCETEGGTYSPISGATELTYTIPAAEVGKFLKCYVTPIVTDGSSNATGTVYTTDDANIDPMYLASIPVVESISISQAATGNRISLTYSISDPMDHMRGIRNLTWKFKDESGTVVKTLANYDADFYVATAADDGLTIFAEVTPKMLVGSTASEKAALNADDTLAEDDVCADIAIGATATSNEVVIDYHEPEVVTGGGGGGGGTGGSVVKGSQNPIEKESAPAYQSPDEQMDTGRVDLKDARGHWAEKEIFDLYDKGVIKGKTENAFDPDGQITRAEFMAILVRAMNLDTVAFAGDFNDVAYNSWYADILATAKQNGLLAGSNGNANPDQAITREEMVQIIVRAYEMSCGEIKVGGGFLDYADAGAISDWAQMAVIKASEIGLVNGTGDGCYSPKANTTRAQSAVLIVRLLPHIEKAAEDAAKAAEEAAKAQEEAAKAEAEAEAALPEEVDEVAAEPEAAVSEETTDVGAEDAPAAE